MKCMCCGKDFLYIDMNIMGDVHICDGCLDIIFDMVKEKRNELLGIKRGDQKDNPKEDDPGDVGEGNQSH